MMDWEIGQRSSSALSLSRCRWQRVPEPSGVMDYGSVREFSAEASATAGDLRERWKSHTGPTPLRLKWLDDWLDFVSAFADMSSAVADDTSAIFAGGSLSRTVTRLRSHADSMQDARQQLTTAKHATMPPSLIKLAVEMAQRLEILATNYADLATPSRSAAISASGIAAAVGFLVVACALLWVGNATATDLPVLVVLGLAAGFGLVAGFGYGATRFGPLFKEVLTGGSS